MSQIETTVKKMEAGEAIAWLEDHIDSLRFAIREMGDDAADVSKELLAECRRLLRNAKKRQRYANDLKFRIIERERCRVGMRKVYDRYFCCEDVSNIENYELAKSDNFKGWQLHHRLETHRYSDRTRTSWTRRDENVPSRELIALGLYYNRPAKELVWMTNSEHHRLHWENRGCAA